MFGSNASSLSKAAKIIEELYPNALIDINMGCPVPKVAVKSQAGSFLLKNPAKVYEIVSEVVKAVSIPVIAIGGITKDNVAELSGSGICGFYIG